MGSEVGPVSPEHIGVSDFRTNAESAPRCPTCGRTGDELRDYGDGLLRCIVCDRPVVGSEAS